MGVLHVAKENGVRSNLISVYCNEKHKSSVVMTVAQAKQLVQQEFDLVAGEDSFKELVLDFFGGDTCTCGIFCLFPAEPRMTELMRDDYIQGVVK